MGVVAPQELEEDFQTFRRAKFAKSTSTVQTASQVLTLPFYAFKITTSTPSQTTTPATSTATVSTTSTIATTTTLPVETDTVTTTSTDVQAEIITTNTITTTTSSITSTVFTTDTTTIAASAGFIPVESSIPGWMKRRAQLHDWEAPEAAIEERAASKKTKFSYENGKAVFSPAMYPQAVKCVGIVAVVTTQTKTRTASKTKIITAPTPVVTSTISFSTTVTVTETPVRASTTVTVTSPSTTTVTTTTTDTSTVVESATVTQAAPQATFYAACADNNIITSFNGQPFQNAYAGEGSGDQLTSQAASAYDCCVTCINTTSCGASVWYVSDGLCVSLAAAGTCSQNNLVAYAQTGTSSQFAFSDSYCGRTAML